MKLSKELNEALEAVSKEVDSWPAWKRSIDLHDFKKLSKASEDSETSSEGSVSKRKTSNLARAAGA